MPLCQAGMKAVAVTFCVLCFQFEALYGVDSCSSCACKNIDQAHISDAQVMVEFENGNFHFTFPNPKNVSEFSMTLFKGREKKEICALHLSKERVIFQSNVTYCQTQNSSSSTTFILKNLERKHIGVYTYCLEIFLPPPYIECCLKETYLYVQDLGKGNLEYLSLPPYPNTTAKVYPSFDQAALKVTCGTAYKLKPCSDLKQHVGDKEDCFSLGLVPWVIIGVIIFAVSCVCCVVACCLRNKNQKCESNSLEYNSEYMPMAAVNAAKKPRI